MNTFDHGRRRRSPAGTALPAGATAASSLLTPKQVAKLLGVSTVTVRRRVREGVLGAVRVKRRLYFQEAAIRAFVERHSEPAWSDHGV